MAIFFTPRFFTGLPTTTKRILYFGSILLILASAVTSFLVGSIALSVLGTIFGGPLLIGLVVITSPFLLVLGVAATNVLLLSTATFFGVKFLLKRCRRSEVEESDDDEIVVSKIPKPDGEKCEQADENSEGTKTVETEATENHAEKAEQNAEKDAANAGDDVKNAEEEPEEDELKQILEKIKNDGTGDKILEDILANYEIKGDSGSGEDETLPMASPEPKEAKITSPEGSLGVLSPESQQTELFTSSGEQEFVESKEDQIFSTPPELRADLASRGSGTLSRSSSQQSTDTEAGKANGSHKTT